MDRREYDDAALLRAAEEHTGLTDWGEDEEFRAGLRVALRALAKSSAPPDLSERLHSTWLGHLTTRLQLIEHRRLNPAVAEEDVGDPLVVMGLPRTGTTALFDLLAEDPAARAPLNWETAHLSPPPDPDHWHDDPRIEQVEQGFQQMMEATPDLAAMHTYGARLPAECNVLLNMEFWSPNIPVRAGAHLNAYTPWLAHAQLTRPYRVHHWALQQLQHHGPRGRWALKSPFHLFDLAGLLAEYPGAMLVQTHRDPATTMPSLASLVTTVAGIPRGHPDRVSMGRAWARLWGTGLRKAMAARLDPAVDDRVLDVGHRSFLEDPLGTVKHIYEHFGLPYTDEFDARARTWVETPSQHAGAHRYTAEEFGLDKDLLSEEFADYRDRFADLI